MGDMVAHKINTVAEFIILFERMRRSTAKTKALYEPPTTTDTTILYDYQK